MKSKIRFGRILVAGLVFAIVAMIVNNLGAFLTMSYYLIPAYFPVWSKLMMPTAGPPPMSFFFLSFTFSFVTGVLFALVYVLVRAALPRSVWLRGVYYGLLVFVVGSIPGYLALLLLINLPIGLVVAWAFESLVVNMINGVLTATINR
jgi:hypothetical protein